MQGTRLKYTRMYNRRIVLETIRLNGPISRVEVAKTTGLSNPSMTSLVTELLNEGLVMEHGRRKGQRGQPAVELGINPNGGFSIGLHVERDHLTGVLINMVGEVLAEEAIDWSFPSPKEAFPDIVRVVEQLKKTPNIEIERLWGVGLALPGPFETFEKTSVVPHYLPKWEGFPIGERLTEALSLPVIMENDATAAAIGEQFHGAGKNINSFFYIYLGVEVGGGMILNGHPYQGASPNVAELGRVVSQNNGERLYCSKAGLKHLYRYLAEHQIDVKTPAELETLFLRNNRTLLQWLDHAVDILDPGLMAINALLVPEAIFFGGRFPYALLNYMVKKLELEVMPMRKGNLQHLHQAKLFLGSSIEMASALGAAVLPLNANLSTHHELLQQNSGG